MTFRKMLLKLAVATLVVTAALHHAEIGEAADGRRVVVEIRGFEYLRHSLRVAVGDVVIWKNSDIVPHTVTAQDDSWDSGLIAAGGRLDLSCQDGKLRCLGKK